MTKKNDQQNKIILFQDKKIRRVWYKDEWWFVINGIITILTDSVDPAQYFKRQIETLKDLKN